MTITSAPNAEVSKPAASIGQAAPGISNKGTKPAAAQPSELEQLRARLAQAEQELADAKASKQRALSVKISEKGALSVYGLSAKFPVTLYASQWLRLLDSVVVKFILDYIGKHSHGELGNDDRILAFKE